MNRAFSSVAFAMLVAGCGQEQSREEEIAPVERAAPSKAPATAAAPATSTAVPAAAPATTTPTPAAPQTPTAAMPTTPTATDGGAQPGATTELGPFEPTGDPLPLAGLTMPAAGARPYVALGLPWPAVSALLDATPGLRVRDHVGFYPPRPIDLTGRPAPYTFGHANALSRPGTWQPAADATFVLVPYHHTGPALAIYAPAGEGSVRFVTKFQPAACEDPTHETGFMLTRRAENLHAIRVCGSEADVTTYRAEAGKLAARVQTVDPATVMPASDEGAAP